MNEADGVRFLHWALPRLGMRWEGFRKPRRQVLRRIAARMADLRVSGFEAYRRRLEDDPAEWRVLESLCRVTISRFYRDRGVWNSLRATVLPELIERARAARRAALRAWSAGCASGEEPTTLRLVWDLGLGEARTAGTTLEIVATDIDPVVLGRARRGVFDAGSLRELPEEWVRAAFARRADGAYALRADVAGTIDYRLGDARTPPEGPSFDVVLCRNLVFTYYGEREQRAFLERLADASRPGAALVVGAHEQLPRGTKPWMPSPDEPRITRYRGSTRGPSATASARSPRG
jgi:chemotaxis protein methyltransferase CheR